MKMGKLKIVVNKKGKDTIARTIRMSGVTFDKITLIAEEKGISFNNLANQLLEYGLDNIDAVSYTHLRAHET